MHWDSVGPLTATNGARVRIIIDRDYLRGEQNRQAAGTRVERARGCGRVEWGSKEGRRNQHRARVAKKPLPFSG